MPSEKLVFAKANDPGRHRRSYHRASSSFKTVAEVREFVYCPRAWAYNTRKYRPKLAPEDLAIVAQRLEEGWQAHREHGEAVCLASRQRRRAANWQVIGVASAGMAILLALLAWGR